MAENGERFQGFPRQRIVQALYASVETGDTSIFVETLAIEFKDMSLLQKRNILRDLIDLDDGQTVGQFRELMEARPPEQPGE